MRITGERPLRTIGGVIAFQAEDAFGPFELWAPLTLWEQLQADAPLPSDGDDRRDHALGMLEAMAAAIKPVTAQSGLRVVIL